MNNIYLLEILNILLIIIIIIILFLIVLKKKEYFNNQLYYKTYYINLAHRLDRKKSILNEIKNMGIETNKIKRIDATKKRLGLYGCLLSHIKALKEAQRDNIDYAVIFEDDFICKNKINLADILNNIKQYDWDVCLLSANEQRLGDKVSNILYKVENSQTTAGYIIRKHYIPILLNFWENTDKGENIENISPEIYKTPRCTGKKGCPYIACIRYFLEAITKKR